MDKELKTVSFHRDNILKRPKQEHLLTLEDADEYKLPAMDKLLKQMFKFNSELNSAGIILKIDKNDQYPRENLYEFTDIEYEKFPMFKIIVGSDWFNPEWKMAIHSGFNFHLYVVQDGYGGRREIADWISISICHLNTTPMTFVSAREHVKSLNFFSKDPTISYFHDIPMNFATTVNFDKMKKGLTFKTSEFNESVEDACKVMQKIIRRKKYLKAI
jgi:hypothetical protein